jgi:predicted ATPase
MGQLYQGIVDLDPVVNEGSVQLFLEEEGGRQIAATRLSDGTLRYLCLLAILLHPEPPPLVAIEEPELGLHPDVLPYIAELLVRASQRTQIFVTTHSPMIVDALSGNAESVIVCERVEGASRFERLNAEHLRQWLEKYTLSKLWSMGQIGGNRW